MDFLEYYLLSERRAPGSIKNWRDNYVYHTTPVTKQRNKVKIASLSAKDQLKFMPLDLKLKMKRAGKDIDIGDEKPGMPEMESHIFTLYYSASRPEGYDKFTSGKLTPATDDSSKAIEIEKSGLKVGVAHKVPLSSFKKYFDYDDNDWKSFPSDISDEEKFELIKFTDGDLYLVDFTVDGIEFILSNKE